MFVAPPEKEVEVDRLRLEGSFRFLARFCGDSSTGVADTIGGDGHPGGRGLDWTMPSGRSGARLTRRFRRVTQDLDPRVHLNTAVSALMELGTNIYAFFVGRTAGLLSRESEDASVGKAERPATIAV